MRYKECKGFKEYSGIGVGVRVVVGTSCAHVVPVYSVCGYKLV